MIESLSKPVREAALALSESGFVDSNFQDCRALILFFLGEGESTLPGIAQQLRPRADGTFRSLKSSNILRKAEDITYLDFWGATSAVLTLSFAGDPKKLALAIVGASLFFLKRARELATIDLKQRDSAVVLALHDASADRLPIAVDDLLKFYNQTSRTVPGVPSGREELAAGLANLERLGVVTREDDKWTLVEEVAITGSK